MFAYGRGRTQRSRRFRISNDSEIAVFGDMFSGVRFRRVVVTAENAKHSVVSCEDQSWFEESMELYVVASANNGEKTCPVFSFESV